MFQHFLVLLLLNPLITRLPLPASTNPNQTHKTNPSRHPIPHLLPGHNGRPRPAIVATAFQPFLTDPASLGLRDLPVTLVIGSKLKLSWLFVATSGLLAMRKPKCRICDELVNQVIITALGIPIKDLVNGRRCWLLRVHLLHG